MVSYNIIRSIAILLIVIMPCSVITITINIDILSSIDNILIINIAIVNVTFIFHYLSKHYDICVTYITYIIIFVKFTQSHFFEINPWNA